MKRLIEWIKSWFVREPEMTLGETDWFREVMPELEAMDEQDYF